jgi:hypothetical protein
MALSDRINGLVSLVDLWGSAGFDEELTESVSRALERYHEIGEEKLALEASASRAGDSIARRVAEGELTFDQGCVEWQNATASTGAVSKSYSATRGQALFEAARKAAVSMAIEPVRDGSELAKALEAARAEVAADIAELEDLEIPEALDKRRLRLDQIEDARQQALGTVHAGDRGPGW